MATTNINGTIIAIGESAEYDYFCHEYRVPITVATMSTIKIVRIPARPCAYPYYLHSATGAEIKQSHPDVITREGSIPADNIQYACLWDVFVYPAIGDEVKIQRDYQSIAIRIVKASEDREVVVLSELPQIGSGRIEVDDILEDLKQDDFHLPPAP